MNKKGFIFMESIVVLVVVILATTLALSSYTLIIVKQREKEYYNLPQDKYLLFNISKLGVDNTNAYTADESFVVTRKNCETKMGTRLSDCEQVFKDTGLAYFAIVNDVMGELKQSNATQKYNHNGLIEFMKSLRKCHVEMEGTSCAYPIEYVIGVFYRNGHYYYAAVEF